MRTNCSAPQNLTLVVTQMELQQITLTVYKVTLKCEMMFVLNYGATDMHYWFLTCNTFRVRGGHKLINLLTDGVNSNVTGRTL